MKYEFHRPVKLAGKLYSKGLHEVTGEAENDHYFLKAVGEGWISEPESSEPKQETPKERGQRLLAKLSKKGQPEKVEEPSAPTAPVEEPKGEATGESEKKKGGKKPR